MCYFKDVTKMKNMNEIQTMITRIILHQIKPFNYKDIVRDIKQELERQEVAPSVINSFRINNMIIDTLDQIVSIGSLYCFNNVYVPLETVSKKEA